jgi:hypothetical protein
MYDGSEKTLTFRYQRTLFVREASKARKKLTESFFAREASKKNC